MTTLVVFCGVAAEAAVPSQTLVHFFTVGADACEEELTAVRPRIDLGALVLRRARISDRAFIDALQRDPAVISNYFVRTTWSALDREEYFDLEMRTGAQRTYAGRRVGYIRAFRFVIEARATRQRLGFGVIQRTDDTGAWELGYAIARRHRGQGHAAAVTGGLVRFARLFAPHPIIEAQPLTSNAASRAVLRRSGFRELAHDVVMPGRAGGRTPMRWTPDGRL